MSSLQFTQTDLYELDERLWNSGLFICGHPKSGTSLLMTMLDSHPELIVYPEESHFFRRFVPAHKSHPEKSFAEIAGENLLHIFEWNQDKPPVHQQGFPDRDYSEIDAEGVRDLFQKLIQQRGGGAATALPAAMISYGITSGQVNNQTKYWVEKTPYNEQFAEEIFKNWSNAKCLHIVRDPRDNYASYKRKHTEWTPEHFAYSWWKSAQAGRRNIERFGSKQYLLIRYEELVANPDDVIHEITEFLDIEDDPVLRTPTRAGGRWKGNSMFGDNFRGISAKPAGRYIEYLSRVEIGTLESLLRPEMLNLGYPLETNLSFGDYVVGQIKRIKWGLKGE